MAELALIENDFLNEKGKYTTFCERGSVVVALSDRVIRAKWLEIFCDLCSPIKRNTSNYDTIPGWDKLCEAWTPELWAKWWHLQRPMKPGMVESWPTDVRDLWESLDKSFDTYRHGFLSQETNAAAQLWTALIEPLGVLQYLPKEPTGQQPVYNTWGWSDHERSTLFIVVNDDAPDVEIETWSQLVERDGDTGVILPKLLPGTQRDPKINVVSSPRKLVRYETDLGLSSETLSNIHSDKIVHPRFDRPVAQVKFIEPDVTALRVA